MHHIILSQYSAASANLKLAEKYYNKRFEELRSLLLAEEVKFKYVPVFEHVYIFKFALRQDHLVRN